MPDNLADSLVAACDASLLYTSRTHRLPSFDTPRCTVSIKREDESGWGISGCKKRKYASLMPWLAANAITEVGVIGGENSNNVSGILQLLHERRTGATLLLKAAHRTAPPVGNAFLTHLLAHEGRIQYIPAHDWANVETLAPTLLRQGAYVLPEGATCTPAYAGACTLGLDIPQGYDHIFIDAGTGLMAAALACTLAARQYPATVHVVLVAGSEDSFATQIAHVAAWLGGLGFPLPQLPAPTLHFPATARSFGSVNSAIKEFVRSFARTEGVLTDPVYTAKLFFTARHTIQDTALEGNALIIHSGGGMGLMGFSEM